MRIFSNSIARIDELLRRTIGTSYLTRIKENPNFTFRYRQRSKLNAYCYITGYCNSLCGRGLINSIRKPGPLYNLELRVIIYDIKLDFRSCFYFATANDRAIVAYYDSL